MSLSTLQQEFTHCFALLILHAEQLGYRVTMGDGYRDPRSHGKIGEKLMDADGKKIYGRKNSNHKRRLAHDINLFLDGVFLQETEHHRVLGKYWETLHPMARWGGHYNDGNHYSFLYKGYQ